MKDVTRLPEVIKAELDLVDSRVLKLIKLNFGLKRILICNFFFPNSVKYQILSVSQVIH